MSRSLGQLNELLTARSLRDKIPAFGSFELTSRCNLSCKMCFVCSKQNSEEIKSRELTAKQWIQLGREARDAGMLYLLLSGGEIFIRSDFQEIYEGLSDLGLLITLNTNATLLTPDVMKWLVKRPPLRVAVSIYGSSPEAYARVCGNANGYEQAMRGIRLLEENNIQNKLRTVMIRDTREDLCNIVGLILGFGKQVGMVSYVAPCRDETGNDPLNVRYSPEEQQEADKELETYIKEYNEKKYSEYLEAQKNLNPNDVDSSSEEPAPEESVVEDDDLDELESISKSEDKEQYTFRCMAGRASFWVTWDGRMTPCALAPEPASYPSRDGFEHAWGDLVKESLLVPKCTDCIECADRDYCMTCPARLKVETGFFDKKSEYLCEKARLFKIRTAEKEKVKR